MIVNKLRLPVGGNETALSPAQVMFGSSRTQIDSINGNTYFGPNQPYRPAAPRGTLPRAWDYPMTSNMVQQPRTEEPGMISFQQLRSMADNCDIVRIVIEHRKKQIVKVPWVIKLKEDPPTMWSKKGAREGQQDPRVKMLNKFFQRPDRIHNWPTWLSMILEEVFVIDALSIWPMYDQQGMIQALNVVDGSTIKPLHDAQGWPPTPPNPSFQQFIKGTPAVNMTSGLCDQCTESRKKGRPVTFHWDTERSAPCSPLIYQPRNPRVHKFYGFAPVEWIIRTMILAMNRQVSQISYYTEGNVPEMIIQAPEEWDREQIQRFQQFVDSKAGDLAAKRRMWFVPETKGILQTKEHMLKDEMDEWIARVTCFPFGVNPQPFVRMMNRATSQVASESAAEEGTIPDLEYIASLINYIISNFFFFDDIEFCWKSDIESDGLKEMRINTGYTAGGVLGVDEVRSDLGLPAIGIGNIIVTKNGPIPLTQEVLDAAAKAVNPPEQNDSQGTSRPTSSPD